MTTEIGTSGYLWYLKSEHEARIRFEDQLEMAMIEAEKANNVINTDPVNDFGGGNVITGSDGLFSAIEERGLVYEGANFGDPGTGGAPIPGGAEVEWSGNYR